MSSDAPANLTNRDADVALRVVHDAGSLPLNLYGQKGPDLFGCVYLSRERLADWRARSPESMPWILKEHDGVPEWAHGVDIAVGAIGLKVMEAGTHIAAAGQGLGLTALPCFVGDRDPLLARAPGAKVHRYGSLYLLTQGETRQTKRLRLFNNFIAERLASHADLLEGRCPRSD